MSLDIPQVYFVFILYFTK